LWLEARPGKQFSLSQKKIPSQNKAGRVAQGIEHLPSKPWCQEEKEEGKVDQKTHTGEKCVYVRDGEENEVTE
jgi:hypothetical protein